MTRIPLVKADIYAHEDEWEPGASSGIAPLAVDHLGVEANAQAPGRVSLVASGPHPEQDGYGVSFVLDAPSARLLAAQLIASADASDHA